VTRGGREPLIAIVQLRKCNSWVLPKGKLNANENALAAARREVLEEVGHKVHIHEFLGTMSHDVGNRTKVVQFWRMRAIGEPVGSMARDVKAVRWLPLEEAVGKLTRLRERAFLESIAPAVRAAVERSARQDRDAERQSAAQKVPIEPAVQPADPAAVEPIPQPAVPDVVPAAEQPVRDNIADKVRVWFRRISLLSTHTGRRA
jgi:8-oxo-dGTP diphosphatase